MTIENGRRRQRRLGRAVVACGRAILPPVVGLLPTRLQLRIKSALPCVFGKRVKCDP